MWFKERRKQRKFEADAKKNGTAAVEEAGERPFSRDVHSDVYSHATITRLNSSALSFTTNEKHVFTSVKP